MSNRSKGIARGRVYCKAQRNIGEVSTLAPYFKAINMELDRMAQHGPVRILVKNGKSQSANAGEALTVNESRQERQNQKQ